MKALSFVQRPVLLLAILALLLSGYSMNVLAAPLVKPRVAIKQSSVGEGVSKYSKKYLNLSTILDEMEASIQKSRKFELLSRKKAVLKEIREEQNFAKSDLTKGNAAPEGQIG